MTRRSWPILFALLSGCGGTPPSPLAPPLTEPTALEADGLHNLFRVSDRVFSGSSPDGDTGFASLGRLGVKTVISVDGAKPDVAAAEKYGLRYVHLPIGYDGIPSERATFLARAVRDLPGPVYIHCHHGKHRGPAACAAVQLTLDPRWSPQQAERWLTVAGTDPKYTGLVGIPHTFKPPASDTLDTTAADFPTVAKVTDLVRVMVEVDERWDHLKAVKTANWKAPKGHPDLDPPHEAVILTELYREAARLDDSTARGKEFLELLGEGEATARDLEGALRAGKQADAATAFGRSQALCAKCHEKYRDRK